MIIKEHNIVEIVKKSDGTYELISSTGENGYNLCEASWTEVPRWHKDGTIKTPEEFRREQVAKSGEIYFSQNFGNCVGYDTIIELENINIKIGELYDSL